MAPPKYRNVGLLAASLTIVCAVGCGDSRDPTDPKTLYGCAVAADCLEGFVCSCGWCQAPGETVGCDASANDGGADAGKDSGSTQDSGSNQDSGSAKDSSSTQDSSSAKDSGSTADTGSGPCNVQTWAGCPTGQGCYYDGSSKKAFCQAHGSKKINQKCSNQGAPQCGKNGATAMLCDSVTNTCLTLCDTAKAGPCPAGQTCFVLQEADQSVWPDNAGICAP